jgi:hypothetical protein
MRLIEEKKPLSIANRPKQSVLVTPKILGGVHYRTANIALKNALLHHEEPAEQTSDETCDATDNGKRTAKDTGSNIK